MIRFFKNKKSCLLWIKLYNITMPKRVLWKVLRYFYPCVIVILALEIILRVFFHAPMGYFNFLVPSRKGIYPPNAVIFNYWGKIPYTVYSNSQGLRGDELSQTGKRRIVCIGDSNTDGLFVDNNETFPYYLQLLYDDKYPGRFEVINAARGGGSIDKELVLLKAIALPLKPELVVLTFCPNDIHEIYQITLSEALNKNDTGFSNLRNKNRFIIWLVTKTALGETMFRFYHVNFIVKKFYKGDMREFKYNCAPQSQSNIRQNLMIHEKIL